MERVRHPRRPGARSQFYADVLGMGSEDMDMGEADTYTVLTNAEGRQIGGAMNPPMLRASPPHWNVYFNVEDVDASVAKAEELGAQIVAPAFDVPGVGRMAMVADPQGADVQADGRDTADADASLADPGCRNARRRAAWRVPRLSRPGTGRRGRRRAPSPRW